MNAGSSRRTCWRIRRADPGGVGESALNEARILEDEDFFDLKISVKHSNPLVMIEAYRQLAEKCDYPFHLGVTEAGPMPIGGVKSAVGVGTLLAEGIGDTVRVSLTDDPVEEVKVGTAVVRVRSACGSAGWTWSRVRLAAARRSTCWAHEAGQRGTGGERNQGPATGGRHGLRRERAG